MQVETFLTSVLIYGYHENKIKQFSAVQMGAETKEAYIAVDSDDDCEEIYILVVCKKEDLTDQHFNIADNQAYS